MEYLFNISEKQVIKQMMMCIYEIAQQRDLAYIAGTDSKNDFQRSTIVLR